MSFPDAAPRDRPRVRLGCVRMMARLKLDKARGAFIRGFMVAYLHLSAEEGVAYHQELPAIAPDEQEAVMQISIQWEEIEEARVPAQGLARGGAEVVLRRLRRRLGALPFTLESRVGQLSLDPLDELADATASFAGPNDLEAPLAGRG